MAHKFALLPTQFSAQFGIKAESVRHQYKVAPLARRTVTTMAASAPAAEPKKLWGGRFTGATDPLMERFNESLPFDKRMWAEDIQGSQAYARALAKAGVLTDDEAKQIVEGLTLVGKEWGAGQFEIKTGDEDIHTANERRLSEIIGPLGGKLHTGRSRNDQVATDTRLWLYNQLKMIRVALRELIKVAADRAEAEADVIMPGFTHLQPAQTVRWSHWVLSHAASWQRDDQRLADLMPRVATLPLGSGALAGNPFGVDRRALAEDLGFIGGVCPNSMDAVSDRDYVAEMVFFASMHLVHLSRWAEDLIIYSSGQFKFVQCSDAYATGSSLMPQKKNPDALELIRGKGGRMVGNMAGLMAVVKGTPTTYNKDLQEVWELMYDTVDTVYDCVRISTGVLSTLKINPDRMLAGLSADMLATDLAEYLVRKGVPFRETHHISGAAVKMAEDKQCELSDLTAEELRTIHPLFDDDVVEVWDFQRSAEMRDTEGGASKRSVLEQVAKLRTYLAATDEQIASAYISRIPKSAMMITVLMAVAVLASQHHLVEAGCKKRRATNVQSHEWSLNAQPLQDVLSVSELPQNFSWLDVNGINMVAPSWNQHIGENYCGACWAHGTLSMIQDRLKIVKKGIASDVTLGRQTLLNCAAFHDYGAGCDGGDVIDVLRYMARFGLPDESCMPYSATDHTKYDKHAKHCPSIGYCMNCMPINDVDTCWAVKTPIRYYVDAYGQVSGPGEEPMMNEIAARGPITCSMATPETFDYGYNGGIAMDPYHNSTAEDVDHDVEIVGWGVSPEGQKYWVVRNSWGTYWGQLGFFLLERGTNALEIESGDCWWAVPTWQDEQDVRNGAKVGTMWGIMTPEEAAEVLPEPGTKPHRKDPDSSDEIDFERLGERNPWQRANADDAQIAMNSGSDAVLRAGVA